MMAVSPDYLRLIDETKRTLLEYAVQDWPVVKSSNGVEVSTHQCPNVPVKIYRAVGEIDVPPERAFEYVVPGPTRLKWDKSVKLLEVVEEITEDIKVLRSLSRSAARGLISTREYFDVVAQYKNYEGGLCFTCGTGIDYNYPRDPKDPKLIRGTNYPSGVLCFPVDGKPHKTRLVYIVQTDLKGKLPLRLIDSALPSMQITFFSNFRKAIKDKLPTT